MEQISKYFHTIRYLKLRQIVFILLKKIYWLLRFSRVSCKNQTPEGKGIKLLFPFPEILKVSSSSIVSFLNINQNFDSEVNWEKMSNGNLWLYNLHYFDYLNSNDLKDDLKKKLLSDYIDKYNSRGVGSDSFVISLRNTNWIKYVSSGYKMENKHDSFLYQSYRYLQKNPEYHLLGNHLLENGFSLLFGAYYFQDSDMYLKSREILISELVEQILPDGAHFELSPMYHRIMLFRVLDCINLIISNSIFSNDILPLLREKAQLMILWMNTTDFADGDMPLVNDSAYGIAPDSDVLRNYADRLGIKCDAEKIQLKESGYRKYCGKNWELLVDTGNIGPDYIPGHAHSDTFNFLLYIDGKPVVVDTGVSTYEKNERRQYERSTEAHNTVKIGDFEQSEVWGGFRVARRAKVRIIDENCCSVTAEHDGYQRIGALHTRKFVTDSTVIKVYDWVKFKKKIHACRAFIHFYPGIVPEINGYLVKFGNVVIKFEEAASLCLDDYLYAPEFNRLVPGKRLVIEFKNSLITEIQI